MLKLSGVGKKFATTLYGMGFRSAEDITKAEVAELASIKGVSEKKAEEIIQGAIRYMRSLSSGEEKARDEEKEGVCPED